MFASDSRHQLLRYYALENDPKAAGRDAFTANWLLEPHPYINPPWFLIPRCLAKIKEDQAVAMMVVPKWEHVQRWPLVCALCVRHLDLSEPIHLLPDKTLWKKPAWDTRIGVLECTRRIPAETHRCLNPPPKRKKKVGSQPTSSAPLGDETGRTRRK